MTELYLHIAYLIRKHDCVILPTLGAFIAGRRKAVFNADAGVVAPPSMQLMFNASITNNDGLLVNSYVRRNNVSFAEAAELLEKDIRAVKNQLATEGKVDFPGIGTLTLGGEDNIIFTPECTPTQQAAMLGMTPMQLSKIAVKVESESDKEIIPEHIDKPLRSDKYYYVAINKTFARVAAIFILVLGVALAVILPQPMNNAGKYAQDCASVIPLVTKVERKNEIKKVEKAIPAKIENPKYMLVVGTFTKSSEVERFMKQFSNKGYSLDSVRCRKYIYVTAAVGNDRLKLQQQIADTAFTSVFKAAWIATN